MMMKPKKPGHYNHPGLYAHTLVAAGSGSTAAYEAKLASSGITWEQALSLGMRLLSAEEVVAMHKSFRPDPAIYIPYNSGAPHRYYRIRYLTSPKGEFGQKSEAPRYQQEPATLPAAYYPWCVDWHAIAAGEDAVLITEGELKAAKACLEGFPTIGLGGVHAWRALKRGVEWLPTLDVVPWPRRSVYIVFDSDYHTNPAVCAALAALAEELDQRGAYVHIVSLPALPGVSKTGLDDYLVYCGGSAPEQFGALLASAVPLGLSRVLFGLNESYVYVLDPGVMLDRATRMKIAPTAWVQHRVSTLRYQQPTLSKGGDITYKPTSAAQEWMKWGLRLEVGAMTYEPGKPEITKSGEYNTWSGWGVEPVEGDVAPFYALLAHLCTGSDDGAMEWLIQWLAYPIQHPGAKMYSSAVLHGVYQGTGKSLVGYTMGRIYGDNFTEIRSTDLHGQFNTWAEGKQLAMGDDVTGSDKREIADFLKAMITQKEIRINTKNVPAYTVPDCLNYLFTSQSPDAFFLEDNDRRFFIIHVQVPPLPDEFYQAYMAWLDSIGASALFYHLQRIDLSAFNPRGKAMITRAKALMIADSRSDISDWCHSLIDSPAHTLVAVPALAGRDLLTSTEMLMLYDPLGGGKVTRNGIAREFLRAGGRRVLDGEPVRILSGSIARYYVVRNEEHWLASGITTHDVVEHILQRSVKVGRPATPPPTPTRSQADIDKDDREREYQERVKRERAAATARGVSAPSVPKRK